MKRTTISLLVMLLGAASARAGERKVMPAEPALPRCSPAVATGAPCLWQPQVVSVPSCSPGIEAGSICRWPASAVTFPLYEQRENMMTTQPRQNVAVVVGAPYRPEDGALPLRRWSVVFDAYRGGGQDAPPTLHLTGGSWWWAR